MYKIAGLLVISLWLYATGVSAQKKYLYEEKETTVVAPPVEEVIIQDGYNDIMDDTLVTDGGRKVENNTSPVLYHFPLSVQEDTVNRWKNMNEFAYAKYLDSLLRSKKLSVEEQKRRLEREVEKKRKASKDKDQTTTDTVIEPGEVDRFLDSRAARVVFWILGISFILFILYSLFLRDSIFKKPVKKVKDNTGDKDSGLLDLAVPLSEMDRKILDAVQQGNYRLAIRYHFIKNLQQLVEKKYVQYSVDKTNFQYVNEIADVGLRNGFASLTLSYEYIWYGEFDIDRNVYGRMATMFNDFYGKI